MTHRIILERQIVFIDETIIVAFSGDNAILPMNIANTKVNRAKLKVCPVDLRVSAVADAYGMFFSEMVPIIALVFGTENNAVPIASNTIATTIR